MIFVGGYFIFSFFTLVVLCLLPRRKIQKLYERLDAKEEEKRIQNISPFVQVDDAILDIGSGSGRFGKAVQDRLRAKVTGVDVCDYADLTIPFFVYDGIRLPFPDDSFDVVFLAFVLHHTNDHNVILKEACRVARKKIIIFEDTYEWFWERLFTCWNDYHTNILQGRIKAWKGYLKGSPAGMPMPFTFRSVTGWRDFFLRFPVRIAAEQLRTMGYKPLKKITFCLEKQGTHY